MKLRNIICLISLLFCFAAQAQERQVHLDRKGEIQYIDANLEKKLSLFPEIQSLKDARLFQLTDTTYNLEILYEENGKTMKQKRQLNAAQIADFRALVSSKIDQANQFTKPELNQDGRLNLIVGSTITSLAYYGWVVPEILNVEGSKQNLGMYMLTSGAGFIVPYLLTKNVRVSNADATLTNYGLSRGVFHGISLAHTLKPDLSDESKLASGLAFSVLGGLGGYYWAENTKMNNGRAMAISAFADNSTLLGIPFPHALGIMNENTSDSEVEKLILSSMLTGAAVGTVVGANLSADNRYSGGDALVMRGTSALGAYLPVSILVPLGVDNPRVYTTLVTAGTIAGMYYGHNMAKKYDFSTSQGILINLSELVGGFVGLGVGYLISSEEPEKIILPMGALGALGGFVSMKEYFAKQASTKIGHNGRSFNFNINPQGLLGLMPNLKMNTNMSFGNSAAPQINYVPPILNAQLRF